MSLLLILVLAAARPSPRHKPTPTPRPQPFALVELFTSEGCSSCPAADALLASLVGAAEEQGSPVYGMSCHVDYWDSLGWRDPYGMKLMTERQNFYSRGLKDGKMVTPQFVINGRACVAGADAESLKREVRKALLSPVNARIEIQSRVRPEPRQILVDYAVFGVSPEAVLQIAAVESDTSSRVEKGENSGQTLSHRNVLRLLRTVPLDESMKGHLEMRLPNPADVRKIKLFAFIQDLRTLSILATTGG